jgi:hypothetical protein
MGQRPSLTGITAEFTGGCTDATIATPDVPTGAPTTGVLPPTTAVLPPTMGGGTGTAAVLVLLRWPSVVCVLIDSERSPTRRFRRRARVGRVCQELAAGVSRHEEPS